MTISHGVHTPHGLFVSAAKHRVEHISLDSSGQMTFHLRSYYALDKPFFSEQVITAPYDEAGESPIKQAYTHVLAMPEFTGAVLNSA